MEYLDPIETARRVLAGESLVEEVEEEINEDLAVEEGKVPPQFLKKKKKDDDEDEDEEDVEEDVEDEDEDEDEEDEEDDDKKEGVINPKSEEDKDLYKDAEGKGAKVIKPTGNASGKNKGTIKTKPSSASSKVEKPKMKEHMNALFNGEELSEEFKTKASTIFETAINERISEVEAELRSQHEEVIEEHTKTVSKELAEKLDDYLSYVVEQWMQENEVAIETGIRADVAESFLGGLKDLFEANYIEVPDEKTNLVETLAQTVIDLEEKLQEELNSNIELKKEVQIKTQDEIFAEVTEDLVDMDVEKLRTLAENLEFDDSDSFKEKLQIVKDNYITDGFVNSDDDISSDTNLSNSGTMGVYVDALSKSQAIANRNKLS